MPETAVHVEQLTKAYAHTHALKGISFTIRKGERVALLGPNGSGKTTTLEILGGFLHPTGGYVRVLGAEPQRFTPNHRTRLGFVFQDKPGLYPELSVRETIELFRGYYPSPRPTPSLLAQLDLDHIQARRVHALSGGERRRLELALAVVGNPRVAFLDEPTTGLDPEARQRVWGLIEVLARDGMTLFLTTHNLEEARRLAQRLLILKEGRILFDGPPQALIHQVSLPHRIHFRVPPGSLPPELAPRLRQLEDGWAVLESWELESDLAALKAAHAQGMRVEGPTLEEAYLALIGGDRHAA